MSLRAWATWVAIGVVAWLAPACGEQAPCQGSEACACFPNGTCNDGLSCASGFCVDLDGEDDAEEDGGLDGGSGDASSGETGSAGTSGGRAGNGGGAGNGAAGDGSAGSGSDGGAAGSGGTIEQGDTCEESVECAALEDPCRTPVCISGTCDSASRPEGTAIDDGEPGNCQRLSCADGDLASAADSTDVPAEDDDPCTLSACDGATPLQAPVAANTPAPDSAQTSGDCLTVVCDGQGDLATIAADDPSSEPPADPCKAQACDQGAPALVDAAPGTPCGTDLVCDGAGACVSCGADSTSCTESAQCCGGLCQNGTTCATCGANAADCDLNPANGCETPLDTAVNCGSCGRFCPDRPYVQNAICVAGECEISFCDTGHVDLDGEFENGCEGVPSVGPGGAYAECTMANRDTACGDGELCGIPGAPLIFTIQVSSCGASSTGCFCSFPCGADVDCPASPGGTATPDCLSGDCVLSCQATGSTCPAGMVCNTYGIAGFVQQKICVHQ